MDFPSHLSKQLDLRKTEGVLRRLSKRHDLIDFSSNDYLGFAGNQNIFNKIKKNLEQDGSRLGSGGSRLLSGNFQWHEALEFQLSAFFRAPAALLYNSGYDANVGVLSCVLKRGDRVFYDDLCHASIRDGIRLSNARSFGFAHNELSDLKKKIDSTHQNRGEVYIVVESVYSMDGDEAPLAELSEYCVRNGFYLIVDEAHSSGVFGASGQGLVASLNLEHQVFARIHTFGKALGCHGAVVLCGIELKKFLINFSRSFIYTTAMPYHNALNIKYALEELENTKELTSLKRNIGTFLSGIEQLKLGSRFIKSRSPVQSFLVDSTEQVRLIADELVSNQFEVKPIFYPTVPKGSERIRICIHSFNTPKEIQDFLFLLSTFA